MKLKIATSLICFSIIVSLQAQQSLFRRNNNYVAPPQTGFITNGLVLNLDAGNTASYPGTGTIWTNLISGGNNGTLLSGVGFNAAYGGSLVLNGSNTSYVNITSYANTFAETIIVWAKSATSTWSGNGWIASSRTQNGHIIHPNANTKTVDYYIFNGSAGFTGMGGVTPIDITTPHFYAISTNGSNLHKGYLDGALGVTSTTAITRSTTPSPQT